MLASESDGHGAKIEAIECQMNVRLGEGWLSLALKVDEPAQKVGFTGASVSPEPGNHQQECRQ